MGSANGAVLSASITTPMIKTLDIVGVSTIQVAKTVQKSPAAGSGAEQVQKCYHLRLVLAASAVSSIDLSGSLEDVFGDADVMTKVKGFIIHNRSDEASPVSTAQIAVTGNFLTSRYGASSSWTLDAGDFEAGSYTAVGKTVTNTSADTLTFTNNSGSEIATVDIIILGV